jgi:hypothetical protein
MGPERKAPDPFPLIWMVAPVIPAVACLLPRLFRVRIGWVRPMVCFAVFFAAEPLAVLLLRITHHIGAPGSRSAAAGGGSRSLATTCW